MHTQWNTCYVCEISTITYVFRRVCHGNKKIRKYKIEIINKFFYLSHGWHSWVIDLKIESMVADN